MIPGLLYLPDIMCLAVFSNLTSQVPEILQGFFSSYINNTLVTTAVARKEIQKADLAKHLKCNDCIATCVQLIYYPVRTCCHINVQLKQPHGKQSGRISSAAKSLLHKTTKYCRLKVPL